MKEDGLMREERRKTYQHKKKRNMRRKTCFGYANWDCPAMEQNAMQQWEIVHIQWDNWDQRER